MLSALEIQFGLWDVLLLGIVTAQAMTIAYLHRPAWKVLVMSLPFPFTFGSLAVGAPINAMHATLSEHVQRLPAATAYPHGRWTWTRGKLRSAAAKSAPPLLPCASPPALRLWGGVTTPTPPLPNIWPTGSTTRTGSR